MATITNVRVRAFFIISITVVVVLLLLASAGNAAGEITDTYDYRVQAGETLWEIAAEHGPQGVDRRRVVAAPQGPPDDLLVSAEGSVWIHGERHGDQSVHGTGCALSSAIASGLALGRPLETAVREAKAFISDAIAGAYAPGSGGLVLRV